MTGNVSIKEMKSLTINDIPGLLVGVDTVVPTLTGTRRYIKEAPKTPPRSWNCEAAATALRSPRAAGQGRPAIPPPRSLPPRLSRIRRATTAVRTCQPTAESASSSAHLPCAPPIQRLTSPSVQLRPTYSLIHYFAMVSSLSAKSFTGQGITNPFIPCGTTPSPLPCPITKPRHLAGVILLGENRFFSFV